MHLDSGDYTFDPPTSIGGNGSHWEGCWRVHRDCAKKLHAELTELLAHGEELDADEQAILDLTTHWSGNGR